MKIVYFFAILIISFKTTFAELPIGEVPPKIILEDDLGGRLDGTPWSSEEMISGRIIALFYVDPDEADLNNHVSDALKAENFPSDKYSSVAVGNMAATWMPNFAINIILKRKQEKHKSTVFDKDLNKTLVEKWGLSDDNSNVVLFGKDGRVLYSYDGKFSEEQVKEIIEMVKDNL